MPDLAVARSPIRPAVPTEVRDGWEVSVLRSSAALRLADRTPLTKVLVRAGDLSTGASTFDVRFGRARTDRHGTLVVGSGPGEWLLVARPNSVGAVVGRIDTSSAGLLTAVDVTHGRALMRLSGADAHRVLSKLCAIDLSEAVTPSGAAFRSSVATVATDVIRNDLRSGDATERSYLLHCERSSGQYLFDSVLDAGREFGIHVDGFFHDLDTGDE